MPRAQSGRIEPVVADIADIFMEKMRYSQERTFHKPHINVKGEIIEETTVSVGDLCSSTTHPREVFAEAVRSSAGSVIFYIIIPGDPNPVKPIYRLPEGS